MDTSDDRPTATTYTDDATATTAVVAAEPPARTGFRLRRSSSDLMLGGICGGLAEELDLDPALVRIAAVALTALSSGILAIAYLTAWLLVPVEEVPA